MTKTVLVISLAFILALSVAGVAATESENRYQVQLVCPDKEAFAAALKDVQTMHLDLAGVDRETFRIGLVVSEETLLDLEKRYTVDVIRVPGDGVKVDPQYLQPAEMTALITQLADTYPDLTQLVTIGDTEQGRSMIAIKISDNADTDEDELAILFNGQHHAREVMTAEITTDIVDYLLTNYGTDPQVTHWVDTYEIWVVPQVNLDGVEYVFTNNDDWRKDRHDPPSGSSYYGIDPNRNYPSFWGSCNGSSGSPSSDTYRGQFPAESYCVTNMITFASTIKPVFDISYHSYSELVIYPYGCDGEITPDHDAVSAIGQGIASVIECDSGTMGYSPGTCWELLYATDGGDIDWYYTDLGTFAYVIEVNSMSQGFLPNYNQWRDSTVQRNRAGWQYLLNRMEGPLLTGHILDACTGVPIEGAEFGLQEIPLTADELPRVTDAFGRYWWPVVSGDYTLVASAAGYGDTVLPVMVGSSQLDQDIMLVPTGSYGVFPVNQQIIDTQGDDDGVLDPGETANLALTATSIGSTTNVQAALTSSDPYIVILDGSAVIGNIPDGGTGTTQLPHFQIQASPSAPDEYVAELMVTFSADQVLCAESSVIRVVISRYVWQCPLYLETLDSDPGYTIENSGSNGWEFGQPVAGPSSPYSGTTCYGTNLDGNYSNNATYKLTSTPFDCSTITDTELHFYRWLQNEENWDEAYVEVSSDNQTWTVVWTGYAQDTVWTEQIFDISGVADGQPAVYVRWRLETDTSVVDYGYYIDDISICGKSLPEVTPTPVPTWTPNECVNNGDVNDDDAITAGDAQLAFQIALGSYSPSYQEACSADCNGDESITAGDAQQIFMTALGSQSCVDPL
ncbi:hypothetical protein JXA80_10220 [bacterium]|nr:hypothetical protein [candidate division CSSED10-310 bacterium]